jgi:hypothetical protein
VRAFSLAGGAPVELASFYAYDPMFTGGVRVATGDVNGDGASDIITGAGPGGGPHVRVWSVTGSSVTELAGFYAYDPLACDGGFFDPTVCDGVYVGAGDFTGDGIAEVVTGTNRVVGPAKVFQIAPGGGVTALFSFFPYFPAFPGPVYIASTHRQPEKAATASRRSGLRPDSPVVVQRQRFHVGLLQVVQPILSHGRSPPTAGRRARAVNAESRRDA